MNVKGVLGTVNVGGVTAERLKVTGIWRVGYPVPNVNVTVALFTV